MQGWSEQSWGREKKEERGEVMSGLDLGGLVSAG